MTRLLFAIGTFVPILYGLGLLVYGFSETAVERALDAAYGVIVAIAIATTIAYIVHIIRNPRLSRDKKGLWLAFLIFGTLFAEVTYFFIHVWREHQLSASMSTE